jgi:hypothetical protein
MTIKELIETLKHFPQDLQVVIEYTDHTDYHYVTPLSDDDVNFCDEISSDCFDEDNIEYDEKGDIKPDFENVVVFTFRE